MAKTKSKPVDEVKVEEDLVEKSKIEKTSKTPIKEETKDEVEKSELSTPIVDKEAPPKEALEVLTAEEPNKDEIILKPSAGIELERTDIAEDLTLEIKRLKKVLQFMVTMLPSPAAAQNMKELFPFIYE